MNSPAHILRNDLTQKRETLRQSHQSINLAGSKNRTSLLKRCSVTISNNYPSCEIENTKPQIIERSPQYTNQSAFNFGSKNSNKSEKYSSKIDRDMTSISQFQTGTTFRPQDHHYHEQLENSIYLTGKRKQSLNSTSSAWCKATTKEPIRNSCILNLEQTAKIQHYHPYNNTRYSLVDNQKLKQREQQTTSIQDGLSKQLQNSKQCIRNQMQSSYQQKYQYLGHQPHTTDIKSSNFVQKNIFEQKIKQIEARYAQLASRLQKQQESIHLQTKQKQKKNREMQFLQIIKYQFDNKYTQLRLEVGDLKKQLIPEQLYIINGKIQKISQQIVRLSDKKSYNSGLQVHESKLNLIQNSIYHQEQELSKKISNIQSDLLAKISKFQHSYPTANRISPIQQVLQTPKFPISQIHIKTILMPSIEPPIQINSIYKIDQDGYLLDADDHYMIDSHGMLYQLDETHINALRKQGILVS